MNGPYDEIMQLKAGVRLKELQPQTLLAMVVVHSILARSGTACVITSCNDSKHSERSLHYKGRAFDFRTKHYKFDKQALMQEIRAALGDEFDVLLESLGLEQEHGHVEWDPQ